MEQQEKKGFFRGLMAKISGAEPAAAPTDIPDIPTAVTDEAPLTGALEPVAKPGLFERLKSSLQKTKDGLVGRIDTLVLGKKTIDADTLEELEEILITSDIGVKTTVELIRTLEQRLGRNELKDGEALRAALKEEILARLTAHHRPLDIGSRKPFVLLVIGVNGVGKTTTIGKLASRFFVLRQQGAAGGGRHLPRGSRRAVDRLG